MILEPCKAICIKIFLLYFVTDLQSAHKMWEDIKTKKNEENLMENINRIELQGRVGTVRTNLVNGIKVANFSLVTDHLYKTRDGIAISETTWHNIVAWSGKDMPDLDMIGKGTPLHLVGRLRTNRYTAADGTEKQYYEVLAYRIRIIEHENTSYTNP